jgi:hypothetical protein
MSPAAVEKLKRLGYESQLSGMQARFDTVEAGTKPLTTTNKRREVPGSE